MLVAETEDSLASAEDIITHCNLRHIYIIKGTSKYDCKLIFKAGSQLPTLQVTAVKGHVMFY